MTNHLEINRAHWDELTELHLNSAFYKLALFRNGEIVLDPIVRNGLGDVSGRRLLHLQCHFGLDTLSLARMGADVTGIDFSPVAITAAKALAKETGLRTEFVEADVLDLPKTLVDFDVFASWGAIAWISDIDMWMRVSAAAVKPGGQLYLVEFHPAMLMLDDRTPVDAPFTICYPYDSLTPHVEENRCDYATNTNFREHRSVTWLHGLARILNAAIDAGFVIGKFDEFDRVPWQGLPQLTKVDDHYWALPPSAPYFPLAFALSAVHA
jgi:SAM-dependent methyltransferase